MRFRLPITISLRYAVLLIILLAIASVAASTIISYLEDQLGATNHGIAFKGAAFAVWALSLGFMLIAGAFGLWGIGLSGEYESRRRIGELVNGMIYLKDGMLAVDRRGRIRAANPAARAMAGGQRAREGVRDAFPCLSQEDVATLVRSREPAELQRDAPVAGDLRALRFRSQPGSGLCLVWVCDVTEVRRAETERQHLAAYELIGRVARGAANDFSTLLESISAQALVLGCAPQRSPESQTALQTIHSAAEKGARLAQHVVSLCEPATVGGVSDLPAEHVLHAAELLRAGLMDRWTVETQVDHSLPPVTISGVHLERIVVTLGMAAAGDLAAPGVVCVTALRPGSGHLLNVDRRFSLVLLVSAAQRQAGEHGAAAPVHERPAVESERMGAVLAVVRSIVEEASGELHVFSGGAGEVIYRIVLPCAYAPRKGADGLAGIAEELRAYVAGWQILLARRSRGDDLDRRLAETGASVDSVHNITTALARIEERGKAYDGLVIERRLLGSEAEGLLRAILKLCPSVAAVLLCEPDEPRPADLADRVIYAAARAEPGTVIRALVEAKARVAQRRA